LGLSYSLGINLAKRCFELYAGFRPYNVFSLDVILDKKAQSMQNIQD
jgi:hypothetical protein